MLQNELMNERLNLILAQLRDLLPDFSVPTSACRSDSSLVCWLVVYEDAGVVERDSGHCCFVVIEM